MVLLIKKEDMQRVYTMAEAIEAVKRAFELFSQGKAVVPLRTNIDVAKRGGQALFMPAYVEETESLGVKIVSVFPGNVKLGRPAVPATMVHMDSATGEVCAIMDGTYLTQVRTGAAAGAATDLLARKDALVGALIGAGGQSSSQIEAMLTARNLKEIRIYDADTSRAQRRAEAESKRWGEKGVRVMAVESAAEAVTGADVITTVTTSKKPVFPVEAVKEGAHVNGVGSYTPEMQELPPEVILRAGRVFVDSREAVLAEAGDLIIPIRGGLFTESVVFGELGELVAGRAEGRKNNTEITVFKTVGLGVQDVVTAGEIYRKAKEKGVGVEFPF
ncbi:MAG: Ornithine cyclodeaminase [Synergistales bacterium 53_16]|nr:MAG: Ornithine cyclodeaminase [Synergistales bacterium 53_16]